MFRCCKHKHLLRTANHLQIWISIISIISSSHRIVNRLVPNDLVDLQRTHTHNEATSKIRSIRLSILLNQMRIPNRISTHLLVRMLILLTIRSKITANLHQQQHIITISNQDMARHLLDLAQHLLNLVLVLNRNLIIRMEDHIPIQRRHRTIRNHTHHSPVTLHHLLINLKHLQQFIRIPLHHQLLRRQITVLTMLKPLRFRHHHRIMQLRQ